MSYSASFNRSEGLRKHTTAMNGILETVGKTPLIELEKIFQPLHFTLFAKLEMFNPGGSIKDRPALNIIKEGISEGVINSDTTIVESSSGNMAIGLAQTCNYLNLRFICVVDSKTTKQNIEILRAYGADVHIITEPDPETGDLLRARITRVKDLLKKIPNSFWGNQYANPNNYGAHAQTMLEMVSALKNVDYVFCSTGTCGTLRGFYEYVRSHESHTKIIAVDAQGSAIFGREAKKRLIPGHGSSRVPEIFHEGIEDRVIHVSDKDCVEGCWELLRQESIFAGGSTGGVVSAIKRIKDDIPEGAKCAAIFCDRGERYLDTIYSADWVKKHFGKDLACSLTNEKELYA